MGGYGRLQSDEHDRGLFVGGEANFSTRRQSPRASALMQASRRYFVLPVTVSDYLATVKPGGVDDSHPELKRTVADGRSARKTLVDRRQTHARFVPPRARTLLWDYCGMTRTARACSWRSAKSRNCASNSIAICGWSAAAKSSIKCSRSGARRGFLRARRAHLSDALEREESAGGHFREEHQTEDGEAKRNDDAFSYVRLGVHWRANAPNSARSRSTSNTCIESKELKYGALDEPGSERLAPEGPQSAGRFVRYDAATSTTHVVPGNAGCRQRELAHKGEDPIAFDHDCRKGLRRLRHDDQRRAHARQSTHVQLHMRLFNDGEITIEPGALRRFRSCVI